MFESAGPTSTETGLNEADIDEMSDLLDIVEEMEAADGGGEAEERLGGALPAPRLRSDERTYLSVDLRPLHQPRAAKRRGRARASGEAAEHVMPAVLTAETVHIGGYWRAATGAGDMRDEVVDDEGETDALVMLLEGLDRAETARVQHEERAATRPRATKAAVGGRQPLAANPQRRLGAPARAGW